MLDIEVGCLDMPTSEANQTVLNSIFSNPLLCKRRFIRIRYQILDIRHPERQFLVSARKPNAATPYRRHKVFERGCILFRRVSKWAFIETSRKVYMGRVQDEKPHRDALLDLPMSQGIVSLRFLDNASLGLNETANSLPAYIKIS